jgi:hypothetical protein
VRKGIEDTGRVVDEGSFGLKSFAGRKRQQGYRTAKKEGTISRALKGGQSKVRRLQVERKKAA